MIEQWQELKETITEMRDNDGTGTQQETCKFLVDYMEILEKQMQQPTDAKETIIKLALKGLVKMQIEEGSVGFAVDNDPDHDCCWDDVLAWLEAQPSEDCISREEMLNGLANIAKAKAKSDAQKALMGRVMFFTEQLPSVTPRRDLAETSQDCISREEMLKYQQYLHGKMSNEENHKLWNFIKGLPSVKPKYTDEEIDKAQAVEQAYVDKMVELAVEELKRPKGKWIKIEYDVCTFIYKCSKCGMRVVNPYKYCPNCGAEMSGGGER